LQLRGEYMFVAEGSKGFQVYDVASIANKGVSQRIITAPFSPLGHDTQVHSSNATCVALPTNQAIAPTRMYGDPERTKLMLEDNQEQPIHALYSYAFVTDAKEGLIVVNVDTLADGEPRNNFLERAITWNPGGALAGARHITLAGTIAYIAGDFGVAVVDLDDPLSPDLVTIIPFDGARATALQFRYLFVTDPASPRKVEDASVSLSDAQRIYVARTFAYVAAGKDGLVLVDIETPETPKVYERFTADGRINDARDVIVGTTNASLFAYVADGRNGLKVVQLTSPESQPRFYGFSPDPKPELIAWYKTEWPATALSKGLDRDRGVDETGHQIAIFGRLGSRPFTLDEQQKLYLNKDGSPWYVSDEIDIDAFIPGQSPARLPDLPQQQARTPETR
jgi:hypothetical protein